MGRFRWCRLTAIRCGTWLAGLPLATRLPKEVVEDVTERTGGVPLFVEELTRLLLERGEQGGIQTIPPTLQQSLTARLDRLGPAREVAQIGAVIGRDFSYRAYCAPSPPLRMRCCRAALERLAEADILLVQGVPPDSDYRFKHALIQDAAYENLLKSRRQLLHRRVGETLRDRVVGTVAARAGIARASFHSGGLNRSGHRMVGQGRDTSRSNAQHWLKPQSNSHEPSTSSRPCPLLLRCVANRSSFRSRS